jgi:hypothetical protein
VDRQRLSPEATGKHGCHVGVRPAAEVPVDRH